MSTSGLTLFLKLRELVVFDPRPHLSNTEHSKSTLPPDSWM